jgi:hypothetical protein
MMSCNAAYGQGYASGYAATLPNAYYAQKNGYYASSEQRYYGSMQSECTKNDSHSFTPACMGSKDAATNHHRLSQEELSQRYQCSEAAIR